MSTPDPTTQRQQALTRAGHAAVLAVGFLSHWLVTDCIGWPAWVTPLIWVVGFVFELSVAVALTKKDQR